MICLTLSPSIRTAIVALAACLVIAGSGLAQDSLAAGNEAFRAGDLEAAIDAYENEDDRTDLVTRRFNAGVGFLRQGDAEAAIERFEDVAARARGELRAASLYNLGWAHFEAGRAAARTAEDDAASDPGAEESLDAKIEKLTAAARSYRSALDFFREIEAETDDVRHNVQVAKTALRSALDVIARLEEEKRRREEEQLLEDPPELLRKLITTERAHRIFSRNLGTQPRRNRRLPSRRLRKAEVSNRELAELLHHHLGKDPDHLGKDPEPPAPGPHGQQPEPSPEAAAEEKERREAAREALGKAIEAMKSAELDYAKVEPQKAPARHTTAIRELRLARLAFPIDLPAVIDEAIATQQGVNGAAEMLERRTSGASIDTPGDGVGKVVLDALRDKVLAPVAKFLTPKPSDESVALAEEEEEVVWGAEILAHAEIPPSPPESAGPDGQPLPPQPGQPPPLDEQAARQLSEALRTEGGIALEASRATQTALTAVELATAREAGARALAALERAKELLPRPPKPLEERLRELIEKQKRAGQAAAGLVQLPEGERAAPASTLAEEQTGDGRTAGGMAEELEQRQGDERAAQAAQKVREGEREIHVSAEALRRTLLEDAGEAVERDVAALEEALKILTEQDENEDGEDQQQDHQDQQQDQQDQQDQSQEQQKPDSVYRLDPAQARQEREKMDRERKEEEAKVYTGGSGVTVEKDW